MNGDVQEGLFRRGPTKKALEAELDRAQNTYERLLLVEVPFPKAHELNEEVETWANMTMKNWRLRYMADRTSGGSSEEEKISVTRKVLDVRPPPLFGRFYYYPNLKIPLTSSLDAISCLRKIISLNVNFQASVLRAFVTCRI